MLPSSVDRGINGGPVGRNWLRWFQTLNLSFTFTIYRHCTRWWTPRGRVIVRRQLVGLYVVHCIALCCGFVSSACAPQATHISILASSVNRDVNGDPVGRDWLRQWFQTLSLSFTFFKYIFLKRNISYISDTMHLLCFVIRVLHLYKSRQT